jgi:Lon protease-like protein
MFPLSTVLFPFARLPLHVFEARYRSMVADCLAGDRLLGIVLIARGSEVGGGDQRVDVGARARIEVAQPLPGGHWELVVRATDRIRVNQSYPIATVEAWPSEAPPDGRDLLRVAEAEVRRVWALLSELGETSPLEPGLHLDGEPEDVAWRLCALSPVGVLDRQRLLEAPTFGDRLQLLVRLVGDTGRDATRILEGG